GKSIGAEQDQIVEFLVVPFDAALDLVIEDDAAGSRVLETDDPVRIFAETFVAIAVVTVVTRLEALGHGRGAHGLDLFLRLVGVVGLAGLEQVLGHLPVAIHAQGLVKRPLVVVQSKPAHAIEDGLHGRLGRTLAVGILDAQDEFTTTMARLQPAIERGARTADMQESGWTGGETGTYGHRKGNSLSGRSVYRSARLAWQIRIGKRPADDFARRCWHVP